MGLPVKMFPEEILKTIVDQTNIINIGKGSPILFINGGPGFDHNYLIEPFSYLSNDYELIFYDQPGCGQTPEIFPELSVNSTGEHLACLIQHFSKDQELTLIAHSWGCIVLLSALSKFTDISKITNIIFIAPMPWHAKEYKVSVNNLTGKIPPEIVMEFIKALQEQRSGTEVMSLILDYYTPNPISLTPSDLNLIPETFTKVKESLEQFDYRYEFSILQNLNIILGDKDFIEQQQLQKLIQDKNCIKILDNIGHFPFYEDHNIFKTTLTEMLENQN